MNRFLGLRQRSNVNKIDLDSIENLSPSKRSSRKSSPRKFLRPRIDSKTSLFGSKDSDDHSDEMFKLQNMFK
jgi:hypothetical protein